MALALVVVVVVDGPALGRQWQFRGGERTIKRRLWLLFTFPARPLFLHSARLRQGIDLSLSCLFVLSAGPFQWSAASSLRPPARLPAFLHLPARRRPRPYSSRLPEVTSVIVIIARVQVHVNPEQRRTGRRRRRRFDLEPREISLQIYRYLRIHLRVSPAPTCLLLVRS